MKIFLMIMIAMAMPDVAFAGGGNNISSLKTAWGFGQNAKVTVCGSHRLGTGNACVGPTVSCGNRAMYARASSDEWAVDMLVAMEVTENGARFCPVQIEGNNKNKGNAWTEYALASEDCVWLCKEGYTGSQCMQSVSAGTAINGCDTGKLNPERYANIQRIEKGDNIEDQVAMFTFNDYRGCGVHKGQEHDSILAVVNWTLSGHGAFVQPIVVRAQRDGWKNMVSWATLYPVDNTMPILVCADGFKPNADKNDCEDIDAQLCATLARRMCSGWDDCFDDATMRAEYDAKNGCYQCRCREKGHGFQSAANRVCGACDVNRWTGVSPANGECMTCAGDTMFSASASNTNYCASATGYSKSDLQYGKGKTKSSQPNIDNQCWTKLTPDEYKRCVL